MKKIFFAAFLVCISMVASAKKVKFAVDLSFETISPNGIHVTGDFQTIAGFPGGDWASNTTPLTQEGSTYIYSIIVDIPAFAKYEYKFVNGDQFYEAEFVPVESRVGYNFDDNRWIYVDSLANDTSFVGAIVFAANAPQGLTLVRFVADMQNQSVPLAGAHVAGNFQAWDPASVKLYSFGSGIYEIISYVTAGTHEYKFYNGNTTGDAENVPSSCAVNSNRQIQVAGHIVLPTVCFSLCTVCSLSGIADHVESTTPLLSPNPADQYTQFRFSDNNTVHTVKISDVTGRVIRTYHCSSMDVLIIEKENLGAGVYFIKSIAGNNEEKTAKLIFQ